MGNSSTRDSDGRAQWQAAAQVFSMFSDPTRLGILQMLKAGPRNVGEVVSELGTTQANISKQLQILNDARLLDRHKEGTRVIYSIKEEMVAELIQLGTEFLRVNGQLETAAWEMNITTQENGGVLEVTLPQHFPHDDLIAALERSVGEFQIQAPHPVLLDAQAVVQASSPDKIAQLAARFGKLSSLGPCFAIVVSDDLHYGLSRLFASFAAGQGCDIQVFRGSEEATRWLSSMRQ